MKKVSVIVPAYNAESYISVCIDKLLSQSYKNIEIIVINDGSSDNTLGVLKDYGEKILLLDKPNGGAASARNAGLKIASGEYVMFVDGDDYVDADAVEQLITAASENDADIVRYSFVREYPDGTQKPFPDFIYEKQFVLKKDFKTVIYDKILRSIHFNSAARCMFKHSVINGLLFREDMKTAEDAVFCMQAITLAQNYLFMPNVFYHYMQTGGGLTGHGLSLAEKYKCNFIFSREIVKNLKNWGMNTLKYRLIAYFRIIYITILKVRRG